MGNLFGKEQKPKKKSQVTDIDRAVLGLKKQRDQLRKTQLQIEVSTVVTCSVRANWRGISGRSKEYLMF